MDPWRIFAECGLLPPAPKGQCPIGAYFGLYLDSDLDLVLGVDMDLPPHAKCREDRGEATVYRFGACAV